MSNPLEKYNLRQKKKFQEYVERHAENPKLDWSWVSGVPLLDIKFIDKWIDKPWSVFWLSSNPSLTRQEKLDRGWNKDYSSIHSMEEYEEWGHLKQSFFGFDGPRSGFSRNNKNIIRDVELYPEFPWIWDEISSNENINEEFVLTYIDKLNKNYICSNKAISIEFLKKTMYCWKKRYISYNTNLNQDNLFTIFSKEDLRNTDICNNLSENLGISLDFILSSRYLGWNEDLINYRTDITKEHIIRYPDFPWDWEIISGCSSIDKNFLKTHPNTHLGVFYRYHNGLTIDEVEHLSPEMITENTLCGTIEEKAEYLRKYYAVRIIGNAFFNCYWHVEYAYCRNRLNEQYDNRINEFKSLI